MTRAGFFTSTTKYAVTTSADSFSVDGVPESRHPLYLVCDVPVHLARNEGDATVDGGMRVPADTPILIECFAGDIVSFVAESSGNVWFTAIDRA